ncbi:MAG: mannose-1-phosphate guanylyltransferase/mannose-6-phosphate isomerase [Candidatus Gastranaerophilales bacterium]|nr:mannose-1-phosphate guanylyltransferase/mannose-6-phosphate isomerase [Candidatus Gastranaerophilales bacterium]
MYAIILAGGSGSRLWPLSRELYPKQLLNVIDDESLLQSTFNRLSSFIDKDNIVSITNIQHYASVKFQLGNLSKGSNILAEPVSKNTAPAIACAAKFIERINIDEDPVILVVPSDHMIKDVTKFKNCVLSAQKLAQEGKIVTFGIRPKYPETGYGYINTVQDEELSSLCSMGLRVIEFKEKPNERQAAEYIKDGNFYWNSGIFMFKASVMMKELAKYCADISKSLMNIDFATSNDIDFMLYEKMPNISIDYAVMEHSDKIALVPLTSDWNDLGSWQSIYDVEQKDENQNVITGNVIAKNCKNSLIYSSSKLVSAIGLENVILVETSDAVLACSKDSTQLVKDVYEDLKKSNNEVYLIHKKVHRPWGYYISMEQDEGYLVKIIFVAPRQKLSLQSHNHRSEHWVVLSGKAKIIIEDKEHDLIPGESIDIPLKAKHSLQNPYDYDLKIMEVQKGEILLEDDIIRYEDMYGRVE